MPYPWDDPNRYSLSYPGYLSPYSPYSPYSAYSPRSIGDLYGATSSPGYPGFPGSPRQPPAEPGFLAKLGSVGLTGAGAILDVFGRVAGAQKSGLEWLAHKVAEAEGLNIPPEVTMGEMLTQAISPATGRETPLERGGRRLAAGGADILLDPLTWELMGTGAIRTAALKGATTASKVGTGLLRREPEVAKYAPEVATWAQEAVERLPEIVHRTPIARAAETLMHRGFQTQMGIGALQGARGLASNWDVDPGKAAESAADLALSGGFLALPAIRKARMKAAEVAATRQGARARQAGSVYSPQEPLPTDSIEDPALRRLAHEWVLAVSQRLSGVPRESREAAFESIKAGLPPELQPHTDAIIEESKAGSESIREGGVFLDRLRSLFGDEGPTDLQVAGRSPKKPDTYFLVQRVRDPQTGRTRIVGGAQVDSGSLTFVAGGRAMGSPVSAEPLYSTLDAVGVSRSGYLSPFGARARRRPAEMAAEEAAGAFPRGQAQLSELFEEGPYAQVGPGRREIYPNTGLYSRLREVVDSPKTQGTQTGEQWFRFLSDPNRQVKKAEMEDTGLAQWLRERSGQRVKREEIQQYLDQNQTAISEVALGYYPRTEAQEARKAQLEGREQRIKAEIESLRTKLEDRVGVENPATNAAYVVRRFIAGDPYSLETILPAGDLDLVRLRKLVRLKQRIQNARERTAGEPTQYQDYSDYRLPGGEPDTYAERVLVTPTKPPVISPEIIKARQEIEQEYRPRIERLQQAIREDRELELPEVVAEVEKKKAEIEATNKAYEDLVSELGQKYGTPTTGEYYNLRISLRQKAFEAEDRGENAVAGAILAERRKLEDLYRSADWYGEVSPTRVARDMRAELESKYLTRLEQYPLPEQAHFAPPHFGITDLHHWYRSQNYWRPVEGGPSVRTAEGKIVPYDAARHEVHPRAQELRAAEKERALTEAELDELVQLKQQGARTGALDEEAPERGEKILNIHEFQSDLQNTLGMLKDLAAKIRAGQDPYNIRASVQRHVPNNPLRTPEDVQAAETYLKKLLPLPGEHITLAAKRVLAHAAQFGYDRITWTTGQQQIRHGTKSTPKLLVDRVTDAEGGPKVRIRSESGDYDVTVKESEIPLHMKEADATKVRALLAEADAKKAAEAIPRKPRKPRLTAEDRIQLTPIGNRTVPVTDGNGTRTIPAFDAGIPGLFIAEIEPGKYTITHEQSGYSLTGVVPKKSLVLSQLQELRAQWPEIDWTRSSGTLLDNVGDRGAFHNWIRTVSTANAEAARRLARSGRRGAPEAYVVLKAQRGEKITLGGAGRRINYDVLIPSAFREWGTKKYGAGEIEDIELPGTSRGEATAVYEGPEKTPEELRQLQDTRNDLNYAINSVVYHLREGMSFKEAMEYVGLTDAGSLARAIGGRMKAVYPPGQLVHSIALSPEARERIKAGYPLYQAGERPAGAPERVTEGVPRTVSPEAVNRTRDFILKVFPDNIYARQNPDGSFTVQTPNNKLVLIRPGVDYVEVNEQAVVAGHGEAARGATRLGLTKPVFGPTRIPESAIVHLLDISDPEATRVALHEHWHVLETLGDLSPDNLLTLERAYPNIPGGKASIERRADAFADWYLSERPAEHAHNTIFSKIARALRSLGEFILGRPERSPEEEAARGAFRAAYEQGFVPEGARGARGARGAQAGLGLPSASVYAAVRKAVPIPPSLLKRLGDRLVGAPPGITDEAGVSALADRMENLARRGSIHRYWYDENAARIRRLTQENREDESKLLQLLAIYSPENAPEPNWNDALQAWDVYKRLGKGEGLRRLDLGEKLIKAGRFNRQDRVAEEALFRDKEWSGLKTNSFYGNLGKLLFPERVGQDVTIDRQMMRALGHAGILPSEQQYAWARDLFKHVAARLGKDWTPDQVQAAVWSVVRAESERGAHGVPTYIEASERSTGAIGLEAIPNRASGHPLARLANLPYEIRRRYTEAARDAFLDPQTGRDELAASLGLLRWKTVEGPGYYQGETNPGWHVLVQLGPAQGYEVGARATPGSVSAGAWEAAQEYARLSALLLRQESAGVVRPFRTRLRYDSGILIEMGRVPTTDELTRIAATLPADVLPGVFFDYSPRGLMVHNISHVVKGEAWFKESGGREIGDRELARLLDKGTSEVGHFKARPFQSVSKLVFPERGEGAWDVPEVGSAADAGGDRRAAYQRVRSRIEAVNARWEASLSSGSIPEEAQAPEALEYPGVTRRVGLAPESRGEAGRVPEYTEPPPLFAVGPSPSQPPTPGAPQAPPGAPPGAPPVPGAVPPPAGPPTGQPAGFYPGISGRATGTPPRVETRVQSLEDAIAEQRSLGIPAPDLILARDTRRTWASLEPEVRDAIREWDDDKILRAMSRHSLADYEVQALDAVTRGRKEAKDQALLDYQASRGTPDEPAKFAAYVAAVAKWLPLERANVNDGTGTARALAARNAIMAAGRTPDQAFLRQVLKEFKGISDADAQRLAQMFETGDPNLSDALRAHLAGNASKFWGLYRANLLSIPSEVANVTGNSLTAMVGLGDRATAAGVDWMLGKLRRRGRERFAGEVSAEAGAMIHALPAALKEFAKERLFGVYRRAWTGQARQIVPGTSFEHQVSPYKHRLTRLLATPLDALGIGDDLFQGITRNAGLISAYAYRTAARRLGQARGAAVDAEAARLQQDIYNYPGRYPEVWNRIEQESRGRVFREDPGELVRSIQHIVNRHKWLTVILPFIKTPANITRYALRHSPLGILAPSVWSDFKLFRERKLSQGDFADRVAPAITGTLITAAVYGLAEAGLISGAGPSDPNERKAKLLTGWQPYSFRVPLDNGRHLWVPYSRFDPVSQIIGSVADVRELKNAKDANDALVRITSSVSSNLSNRVFLRGLMDFGNALSDPKATLGNWVSNVAQSITPGTMDKLAQAIDPAYRELRPNERGLLGLPERIGRTVLSQVPFASRTLAPRYGPTGEEAMRPGAGAGVLGGAMRFFSPVVPTFEREGRELESTMADIGYAPGEPRGYVQVQGHRILLSPEQKEILRRADEKAAMELRRVISTGRFTNLPDTYEEGGTSSKEYVIKRVYQRHRLDARSRLLRSSAFRTRAREQIEEERAKLGEKGGIVE